MSSLWYFLIHSMLPNRTMRRHTLNKNSFSSILRNFFSHKYCHQLAVLFVYRIACLWLEWRLIHSSNISKIIRMGEIWSDQKRDGEMFNYFGFWFLLSLTVSFNHNRQSWKFLIFSYEVLHFANLLNISLTSLMIAL